MQRSDHASVDKSIFVVRIAVQESIPQVTGVLDILEQSSVDLKLGRQVRERHCRQHDCYLAGTTFQGDGVCRSVEDYSRCERGRRPSSLPQTSLEYARRLRRVQEVLIQVDNAEHSASICVTGSSMEGTSLENTRT